MRYGKRERSDVSLASFEHARSLGFVPLRCSALFNRCGLRSLGVRCCATKLGASEQQAGELYGRSEFLTGGAIGSYVLWVPPFVAHLDKATEKLDRDPEVREFMRRAVRLLARDRALAACVDTVTTLGGHQAGLTYLIGRMDSIPRRIEWSVFFAIDEASSSAP